MFEDKDAQSDGDRCQVEKERNGTLGRLIR